MVSGLNLKRNKFVCEVHRCPRCNRIKSINYDSVDRPVATGMHYGECWWHEEEKI